MCGIVGIYLKTKKYEKDLGKFLSGMLDGMATRGPDSAGFAIYTKQNKNKFKYSICLNQLTDKEFKKKISKFLKKITLKTFSDHVILETEEKPEKVLEILDSKLKEVSLVGYGKSINIFKQTGNPKDVVRKFKLSSFSGTHAIGHTRMATESAITTQGSHPYSTSEDECLVHNGSLSNHNNIRRSMLDGMATRGPDSAGFAIYTKQNKNKFKYSICLNQLTDKEFKKKISKFLKKITLKTFSDHVILETEEKPKKVLEILDTKLKEVSLVGYGKSINIFKQTGNPKDVVRKFKLSSFSGTHAIGHTRMATESAITTQGSHPYSTSEDECLVHNGSLSNHNNIRRSLKKEGQKFNSENDTEVAAGYISNQISKGENLEETLKNSLKDLDGFYTFIAGTKDGFALLRDEIACKPAVVAETKDYVAVASEFQCMAHLPNVNTAKIFEPKPGIVYHW